MSSLSLKLSNTGLTEGGEGQENEISLSYRL